MKLALNECLTPFDLESTLLCGQAFRWRKRDGWWFGVVENQVLKVRQTGHILEYYGLSASLLENYFRLKDNLPRIVAEIGRDALTRRAVREFLGLRLARQDPWECLISYICATYKSIPAIRNMISELSKRFGEEITFEDRLFYRFPEPKALAEASFEELRKCGLGFRARYVKETAKIVELNQIDFESLKKAGFREAKDILLGLPGVGNKASDCVLLFSLEKLDSFPIDIWIKRVVQSRYQQFFEGSFIRRISERRTLSQQEYNRISSFARDYFGEYAGYAQEYLYHFIRSRSNLQLMPNETEIGA